ncbi:hypothetical protein ABPG77_007251 [Micractinium sp. CCAP 211/92]
MDLKAPESQQQDLRGPMTGLADVLQLHLEEYQQALAATRGSQATLHAALDRLQIELAAAEAAIPARPAGPPPAARVAKLKERLAKVNRQAAEVEHRLGSIRAQLARRAGAPDAGAAGSGG